MVNFSQLIFDLKELEIHSKTLCVKYVLFLTNMIFPVKPINNKS